MKSVLRGWPPGVTLAATMPQARRALAHGACALLAAAALAVPAGAQIYKWTDDQGVVHLSQDPPPKTALEELPETTQAPLVKNGPPPVEEEPEPATAPQPGMARAPDEDGGDAVEAAPDAADVVVIDGGGSDVATRYRANSPRNRPGEPIRQPRQPRQPQLGQGQAGTRQPRRAR